MADTIIERLFNLAATDNIEGVIALTTHDTIFEAQGPANVPIYGAFSGHAGVKHFFETLGQMFDTEAFEIRSTIENNEIAFGYGYMQHRVKRTGTIFKSEWALVCNLRNGKICHYRMFEDTAALLESYAKPTE